MTPAYPKRDGRSFFILRFSMRPGVRHSVIAVMTLGFICSPLSAQKATNIERCGRASGSSLILVVVVDQLRPDYFERFQSQISGGLKRLYSGGAVFTNAIHDHANTETAPGHSVVLSGRFPSHTGIVLNTQGVPDPQTPLIGGGGSGASPFRFRGSTLIDWIRTRDPHARALSVSRKDRGAILPLGRAHQSVYWYSSNGNFTTSTYYADTLPDWVKGFNARRIAARSTGRAWTPLLADNEYRELDADPAELLGGIGITFPHIAPADTTEAQARFIEFPWMDSATVQLALEGVRAMNLGCSGSTDVLSVSLSTLDAVGHRYGPDSKEVHDQSLRVDRYIGTLIDSLYKLVDSSGVTVALTADHGMAPWPMRSPVAGQRSFVPWVDIDSILASTRQSLIRQQIDGNTIRLDEWALSVDRTVLSDAGINADSLIDAFAARVLATSGVLRVDRPRALLLADTVADPIARRWLHAIPQDTPIDLVITLKPFSQWKPSTYDKHGSPHDYDARVPLILYGPAIIAGRFTSPVRTVDLAPTLATIAGVRPTERLDGQSLSFVLRARTR